jgi:hypothetical protein
MQQRQEDVDVIEEAADKRHHQIGFGEDEVRLLLPRFLKLPLIWK